MEAVILIGIQGSGKTTLYGQRFSRTHIRLSLDMLKTRRRLNVLLRACLEAKQPFVLDNTNVSAAERGWCIQTARAARFQVAGYYFEPDLKGCLQRNEARNPGERIPRIGLFSALRRLERPAFAEGFDTLSTVWLLPDGGFLIEALSPEDREFASPYDGT